MRNHLSTLCWNCSTEFPMAAATCPECGSTNANVNLKAATTELKRDTERDDLIFALRMCVESLATELANVYTHHDALVTRHLRIAIDQGRAALAKLEN